MSAIGIVDTYINLWAGARGPAMTLRPRVMNIVFENHLRSYG
jgi:hypothetical protein